MLNNKTLNVLLILCIGFWMHPGVLSAGECGVAVKPLSFYDNISLYSLIAGFGLLFAGILIDKTCQEYRNRARFYSVYRMGLSPFHD